MGVVFTCSFDDGHPSDMKTADLLQKHGLKGTFFLPVTNWEDGEVMARPQILELARHFEIGSHTYGHCYLSGASAAEARYQISEGKKHLEDVLGKRIAGFCYPGGKYRQRDIELVKTAGFTYARTTMNLRFDAGDKPFEMPTTIQFYPHHRSVYFRNFARLGEWAKRQDGLLLALKYPHWMDRLYALFDYACEHRVAFHLWGHSKQFEQLNAWRQLDDFLAYVASNVAVQDRLSNEQMAARYFKAKEAGEVAVGEKLLAKSLEN
ncbi:polysaccharide deacetylase family protein [Noviherbaspirillum massiliense]|uniref:polysaccharide deacetylase family protein n=1 Tax=Noviherbaspirillum massiliense TaxID=1465823 RepID=UPI000315A35C|nr:polysaccharide deacetylase family protein [Noviherbaspirillum massiliense]